MLCGGAARWLAMAMTWPCGGWTWRWPLTPLGPVPVSGTLRFQLAVSTPAASVCRTEVICIGTTTRCWCFNPQLPRRRPHSDRGRSMRVGPPEKALHPGPDRASPPAPGAVSPPCITARDWGFVSARCYRRPVDPRTRTHPRCSHVRRGRREHSRPAPSTVPPQVVSASAGGRTHFHGEETIL